MNTAHEVGQIIKNRRIEKGYTQLDLARKLFVSEKTISRWECGLGYPSMYIIDDICTLLDISCDELLGTSKDNQNAYQLLIKRNNRSLVAGKIIALILFISIFIFSFFPLNSHSDADSSLSLLNICLFSSLVWQRIIGIIFYLAAIGIVSLQAYDFLEFFRHKKTSNIISMIIISLYVVYLICSLCFELISSSELHTFGFLSFVVSLLCIIILFGSLFSYLVLKERDDFLIKKRYWIIAYLIMLIISVGLYLSSLYLSLVILQTGNAIVLSSTMFLYGVISPSICVYFFLYHTNHKNGLSVGLPIGLFVLLIIFFTLSHLNIVVFQYLMDFLTYLGIVLLPFMGLLFLAILEKQKKEEKTCFLT